jgi:hypothetical protein
MQHDRLKTTEAVVAEWGYIVLQAWMPRKRGEIIVDVDLGRLPQPFAVVGEGTKEDFLAQRAFVDALTGSKHPLDSHRLAPYFYKVATD